MEMVKVKTKKDSAQNINEQLLAIHDAIGANNASGVSVSSDNFGNENENGNEANYPYVIFQIADNKFAVNCKYVLSIEKPSEMTGIANAQSEIRGIAYYKNEAINVFDLRYLFGYISQVDYIRSTINIPQRIRDHVEYEETLKQCIENDTPFKLTVDPRECKFGKWFYSYKDKANLEIRSQLERIEPVHNKFHETAAKVKDLIGSGEADEELRLFDEVDRAKADIIPLLNDLNGILLNNIVELMIVLKVNDRKVGVIVDGTESVEAINEIQELPPAVVLTDYVKKLGLRKKDSEIVLILEAAPFA